MANIALTNYCNLQCPYCFANSYIEESGKQNITMDQLDTILNFLSGSNIGRIGLIGGEPTLHPHFVEILDKVTAFAERYHTHSVTFTNGIRLGEFAKLASEKTRFLVNVNPPEVIGDRNWNDLVRGMKLLFACGNTKNVNLGVNLYPGMPETDFIFDLLKQFRYDQVRVSYVAPTCQFSGADKQTYYTDAKKQFLLFAEKAKNEHVRLRLDCNHVPKCYFTEKELEDLGDTVSGWHSFCTPVVDITPDFRGTACFGAYDPVDLTPFPTLQDAERYFMIEKMMPRARRNAYGKCAACKQHELDICQGGCLVFGQGGA